MKIAITFTIPKLTTIRAHWKWGLLAAFMLAFTLTWSSPVGAPSARAANEDPKTQMDLVIAGTLDGAPVACDSKVDAKCTLDLGSSFTVSVVPSVIPPGGYSVWQERIDYGSLLYKPAALSTEIKWDLSDNPKRSPSSPTGKEGTIDHGVSTSLTPPSQRARRRPRSST